MTVERAMLPRRCRLAIRLSFVTALLMMVGKSFAYYLTGSRAILSDAAESVVHLLAIGVAAFSLWYSKVPADKEHRYGHGKIAYFSAAVEAFLIFATALGILWISLPALLWPEPLHQIDLGLSIIVFLSLINYLLGTFLVRTGKRENAFVLVANGRHVLTDMWTSIGVVFGVFTMKITQIVWLDPFIAIVVALNIIWIAFRLLRQSYRALMDRMDEAVNQKITEELEKAVNKKKILSYHQLRHRKVDERLWIEVHFLFQEHLSIKEAHAKACEVEMQLMHAFPKERLYITTHLEPEDHEGTHPLDHPELFNAF